MKFIHNVGFSPKELLAARMTVYRNLIDSGQAMVLSMRKIGFECVIPDGQLHCDRIIDYRIPSGLANENEFIFDPEVLHSIFQLWDDPAIRSVMDLSPKFCLMDDASYFLDQALRIGERGYVPTEMDVSRMQQKFPGITETRFEMGQLSINVVEICHQRSDRGKWIHCFGSVTSIIFCAALSDYDQVLEEENNTNQLANSIVLFESIVNSRWFRRTSIILFLNKVDDFKRKLPTVPLEKYFPEYNGGSDANKAGKYILWQFMQSNHARLSVYPHMTQAATDHTIIRLVFAAVKETILQNILRDLKLV